MSGEMNPAASVVHRNSLQSRVPSLVFQSLFPLGKLWSTKTWHPALTSWATKSIPANPEEVKSGDIMGAYMQKTDKKLRRFVDEDVAGNNDWIPE